MLLKSCNYLRGGYKIMNRIDFMAQLKRLLSDVPESDRNDAIAYYNDYFDEAGADNEAQVIQELGNPGKVAAMIRASLRSSDNSRGEYTETGYQEAGTKANRQTPVARYEGTNQRRGGGKLALIIILAVFASPFIIGIGGGALGLLIGLIAGLFGIVIALFGAAIAGLVAGIIGIVTGFIEVFVNPATGLLMIGGGLISVAVTLSIICLAIWLGFKIVPKIFRGITDLISRILHRNRGGEVQ